MAAKNEPGWANRIVGSETLDPKELRANARNWRTHPPAQRAALGGLLDQVGWVQQVVFNKRTGNLVDGHLRVELAVERGEPTIPVVLVDLSEEDEALVITTLDPIAAMAAVDTDRLSDLLTTLDEQTHAGLAALLETLRDRVLPPIDPSAEWEGMPEFNQPSEAPWHSIKVHFMEAAGMEAFSKLVEQPLTAATQSIYYPAAVEVRYVDKRAVSES